MLGELWLAIFLASVSVFIVSSVLHMVLPLHKADYKGLPNEDAVADALRNSSLPPGEYYFPYCESMSEMASEEMIEKYNRGPVGFVCLMPNGPMAMGKSLSQWFAMCVVVSLLTGLVASIGLDRDSESGKIFQLTLVCSFLGYGMGSVSNSIWKGTKWSVTAKFIFDGMLYALASAGCFVWMWPSAT